MARAQDDAESTQPAAGKAAVSAPNRPLDQALRPPSLADFVGQARTVERLRVMVGAARREGRTLDHILLHGPPGLGKTTLAMILAEEMGRPIRVTSGPVVERPPTSLACLPACKKASYSSSTKSIEFRRPSKSSSTPRWMTSASTS